MRKNVFYLIIGTLFIITSGCVRDDNNINSNAKVELCLLESFSTKDISCQIDESTITLENSALINYSDFLSYDSSEHIFELSDTALVNIKKLQPAVNGAAFAMKANDVLVYTGYFWPGYSSASCDWIVIDPLMASISNKIQVRLGYPGLVEGQIIPDKRNDERIIRIFRDDNKLK